MAFFQGLLVRRRLEQSADLHNARSWRAREVHAVDPANRPSLRYGDTEVTTPRRRKPSLGAPMTRVAKGGHSPGMGCWSGIMNESSPDVRHWVSQE